MKYALLVIGILGSIASAKTQTVTMKSISFDPKELTLKAGDSVEWVNKSYTEHSATSYEDDKSPSKFDTGMVQPKKTSKKIEFKEPGTYLYHCSVHGKTMTGKLVVTQ